MAKKHLKLRGIVLVVAAWVSAIIGFSLLEAGAAPILYWAGVAGFAVLMCFGLAAFLEAYQQKKVKK